MWLNMLFRLLILPCIICCAFAFLSSSSSTEVDASVDEPDLLKMLDFFKGKSYIGELTTFIKKYKAITAFGVGFMDICLPCKEVYMNAGKTSAALRILGKVAQGHAPDIKDMYDLATKGIGNDMSLHAAERKNKKYMKITNMLRKGSVMSSAPLLEEFLNDVTGKQFTIDPALMKEVNRGSVHTTATNIEQVNMLLIVSSWVENIDLIDKTGRGLGSPPFDFLKSMEGLQAYNSSSLSKIKAIRGGMDNNKYSVSGDGMTFVTDPGVVKIQQDLQRMSQLLKRKSQDQSAAESLVLETFSDVTSLSFRIIKDAENQRTLPAV